MSTPTAPPVESPATSSAEPTGTASRQPGAVVIGSGFGGLGSAIRLQARGYDVTLLEMRDKPGGRAYVYEQDGFKFDAGPTIITAPFLIDELFELAGRSRKDYGLEIVPCDPFYRIVFDDGRVFDYNGDEQQIRREIRKFNPADEASYDAFVQHSHAIFDRAFTDLADQPFSNFSDMLKIAPDLIKLRADRSVHGMVSKFFKDPALRVVFSFHPLLIGGNPFQSSSIYGMIHYLEREWGVHYALGGTGAVVRALVNLFEDMGGTMRLNCRVEEIEIERARATGVRLATGERIAADVVVANSDVANTYRKLVRPQHRRKWTDRKLERMSYSMGLFVLYFGTDRLYPELAHHTIVLGPRYKGLLDDIFRNKVLAEDFSLYLHAPTRTDPNMAPEGCESFYVLSPVPNLRGDVNWEQERERYADRILESLEKLAPDLRKHVVTRRIMTPEDFVTELDAYAGSAFQFEPVLTQSAWFRPHNVSEDVDGLYFAGAGTHPGAGLPGVLSSAKLLDRVIPHGAAVVAGGS
jgi:phytoene desaturase